MFSRRGNYRIPIWCIRLVAALSHSSTLSFRMPIHFRRGTSNILHTEHHMVNTITRKPEAIFVIFINICSERNLFFVQSFSLMLYLFMNFLLLQWKRSKKTFSPTVFLLLLLFEAESQAASNGYLVQILQKLSASAMEGADIKRY